jgi:polyketide biosynthesis 3-hydroxy-3-methylglutaryl-CoA synthase-like enzyme PksG
MNIGDSLQRRYRLSMPEYELLLRENGAIRFGTRDAKLNHQVIPAAWSACQHSRRLVLDEIAGYHRQYRWV